jgi:hypothetical protein
MAKRAVTRGSSYAAAAAAGASFLGAAFSFFAAGFFGAAAFFTAGFAAVLVTRPDLVLLRTVGFSTTAGA